MKLEMTPQMAMYTLNSFNLRTNADNYDNCALDLAIEALKKQIPEKPRLAKFSDTGIVYSQDCPACKHKLFIGTTYCRDCGQKIDWER